MKFSIYSEDFQATYTASTEFGHLVLRGTFLVTLLAGNELVEKLYKQKTPSRVMERVRLQGITNSVQLTKECQRAEMTIIYHV